MPNVYRYRLRSGQAAWAIDARLKTATGRARLREFGIPTREQAEARLAAARSEAYQGRAFKVEKRATLTVRQAWRDYAKVSERDNDSWRSDRSRAAHLLRLLGDHLAVDLGQREVDGYRTIRLGEATKRGAPPSPATLDREVELLKRLLGYAVRCGRLRANPLAGVGLLKVANVRAVVIADEQFDALLAAIEARSAWMRPVLLLAYDSGMRIGEVLHLRAGCVDRKAGVLRLTAQETKSERGRTVALQARTLAALENVPRVLGSSYLFANPLTRRPRTAPRRGFAKALRAAGLEGIHLHDLRRSFATLARKRGIPESVVMKQGGWRTGAVFRRYNIVDESDVVEAAKTMERARSGQ